MSDADFLQWVHDRLKNVHGENELYDYMYRLRNIIAALKAEQVPEGYQLINNVTLREIASICGDDIPDSVDNDGQPYQSQYLADLIAAAKEQGCKAGQDCEHCEPEHGCRPEQARQDGMVLVPEILIEKTIQLCDAVENNDELPAVKYALRCAKLINEVKAMLTAAQRESAAKEQQP